MELRRCYLLLLSLCFLFPVILTVCPYPICSCRGNYIDCSRKKLHELPALTNESYVGDWELTINHNWISNISTNSLPTKAVSLDFGDNPVTDVSPQAFDNSRDSLEVLKFSYAKFTTLPKALLNVKSLKALWIEYTRITDWNTDILKHIGPSLKELVIKAVGLTVWPQWIQEFPVLRKLVISIGKTVDIPENALSHLAGELEYLTINGGNFSQFPKAILVLDNLKNMELTINNLKTLEGLPKSAQLESLDVSFNFISDIKRVASDLAPFKDSLRVLSLRYNELTTIPSLNQMSKLSSVNLNNNQIDDINGGSFSNSVTSLSLESNKFPSIPQVVAKMSGITQLYLYRNSITEIKSTDIPLQLRYLDIGFNEITQLKDSSFPPNSSLNVLKLEMNPLSTISLLSFRNLPDLSELRMSFAAITRVPLALSSLTNLMVLDMDVNSDLVCTCAESQLVSWFKSRTSMSIIGSCGNTDISTFFLTLADQC